jgi:predicted nuclease with TOPRIM domain
METFTFAEAAEVTGISKKALRNRVYRGHLQAVLRDGVRRIPRSELERAGLLTSPSNASDVSSEVPLETAGETGMLNELLNRLERQAGELAELRLITREAESLKTERAQFEAALHETRARVRELEAQLDEAQQPRRWWRRRPRAEIAPVGS